MRLTGPTTETCWDALKLKQHSKSAGWRDAIGLLRVAGSLLARPNLFTYTLGIRSLKKSSRWRDATALLQFLVGIQGIQPDTVCVGTVLSTCKKWVTALHFLERLEMTAVRVGGVMLGQATSSCMRQMLWERAAQLLCTFSDARSIPDSQSFTAGIQACVAEWCVALQKLEEMGVLRMCVDDIATKAAMNSLTQAGLWQKMLQMFTRLDDIDELSCSSCKTACMKSATWVMPLTLLDSGFSLRLGLDIIDMSTVISACEKGRKWAGSVALLHDAQQSKLRIDAVCWDGSMPSGEPTWQLVLFMMQEAARSALASRTCSYNRGISACHRSSQWQLAHGLLKGGLQPDALSYNSAVAAFRVSSQWQEALRAHQAMVDAQLQYSRQPSWQDLKVSWTFRSGCLSTEGIAKVNCSVRSLCKLQGFEFLNSLTHYFSPLLPARSQGLVNHSIQALRKKKGPPASGTKTRLRPFFGVRGGTVSAQRGGPETQQGKPQPQNYRSMLTALSCLCSSMRA